MLIGCGPGATDLLTVRAVQRIGQADLVLYDRLVDSEVLQYASSNADVRCVGKAPGDGGIQQAGINAVIHEALQDGLTVARLKSGDPMVFGRAQEELAVAVATDAIVEIVPGVTAALAAVADPHIGVTERAEIHSFSVVTAKTADVSHSPHWARLLRPGTSLAFYMGVAEAWSIQSKLLASGLPGSLPADWVENAGRKEVRTVHTRLDRIALSARQDGVRNPAILFVRFPLSMAQTVSVRPTANLA